MHLIIYISDYTGNAGQISTDLEDICQTAKNRNPEHDITGLLFYHNGNFLQAIEGEKAKLESLMAALERDPRHEKITRVVDCPIAERGFSDWNMDTFELEESESISRDTLHAYKKTFTSQMEMDSAVFIESLKSMSQDRNLRAIVVS
ncbi:BLUF domain-containing protein [Verrucomicrobiaceae bacterium R5-34]|uniref:BLUF domain-containing protein n=1 Tax=Oceaniferula flava TaxID=2800421 RepID=A0AAE2SEW9_9BACT|nr:BLUF domain-containing protein [Oceaniferula flavus]MBK1831937.1 BLUF domain-containing protein [Verrucomicrobiaceae bacterium R5-34]MBK1855295.1 BLUF domain-containing protein [Oceaniferula flavus]MBM1136601.1 BLUF domain-containing protein [Oceaniferula flavus]